MMSRLGLVTASFDIAIDDEGEYVFLELNQAGQFLWMEDVTPVAEIFARFLIEKGNVTGAPDLTADFLTQVESRSHFHNLMREATAHVAMPGDEHVQNSSARGE